MNDKIKTIFNNPSDNNTWSFEDYEINDDVKFKILCYSVDNRTLTGYVFANDLNNFEKIIYQLLRKEKPNGFVDYYYIYITNNQILEEAKDILLNLQIPKDEIKNVGLFYYDADTDNVIEILDSAQNDNYLYHNYIKPMEIKRLEMIKSINKDKIKSNFNESRQIQTDDITELNDNDFYIDENPLIETMNDFSSSLNNTKEILNDIQDNITWDIDKLDQLQETNSNPLTSNDNDIFDLSDSTLTNDLLEKSEYFRALDTITQNLSDDDLTDTKEILDYLNEKLD